MIAPNFSYLVLSSGITPSVYYYFETRAQLLGDENIQCIDTRKHDLNQIIVNKNTIAIINRYAGIRGLWWLYRHHHLLAKAVYFIDDDMPNAYRAPELSWWYGIKTTLKFKITWWLIRKMGGELWCSTEALASRFPEMKAKILPPVCMPKANPHLEESPVYFYHGTWAHRHEIKWLVPIVREIQNRFPNHIFEIIGNRQVKKMFADIPRVRILPGMNWENYLQRCEQLHYQVGLAPCFDTPFNQVRSHTKLFDITRLGAVGIYSNSSPYKNIILDKQTGILLENSNQVWIEAITNLLNASPAERNRMHLNAFNWCAEHLKG